MKRIIFSIAIFIVISLIIVSCKPNPATKADCIETVTISPKVDNNACCTWDPSLSCLIQISIMTGEIDGFQLKNPKEISSKRLLYKGSDYDYSNPVPPVLFEECTADPTSIDMLIPSSGDYGISVIIRGVNCIECCQLCTGSLGKPKYSYSELVESKKSPPLIEVEFEECNICN